MITAVCKIIFTAIVTLVDTGITFYLQPNNRVMAKYFLFRIARVGIFPRSSLLGAGQVGLWEFGEGGSVG